MMLKMTPMSKNKRETNQLYVAPVLCLERDAVFVVLPRFSCFATFEKNRILTPRQVKTKVLPGSEARNAAATAETEDLDDED